MGILSRIRSNYRYAVGIKHFLSEPLSLEQARAECERRLTSRNRAFLQILEHAVCGNPKSPYHRLLQHAGMDFEDVSRLVDEVGLEGALQRLYDAGVYVTQDELKGRRPIKRGALEFIVRASDFNSPFIQEVMHGRSSGSTGRPTRASFGFQYLEYQAASFVIDRAAHAGNRPMARWSVGSPSADLSRVKSGEKMERYFSTNGFRWTAEGVRAAIVNNSTLLAARLYGHPISRPEFVPRGDVLPVVRWLVEKVAEGSPAALGCSPSLAIRSCLFAREHGFDISGTDMLQIKTVKVLP